MRVLIADDEPLALQHLERALLCIPEVEVAATCASGGEAQRLIQQMKPDVAILDIQMPELTGLALADRIRPGDHVPEIIFLTAYSEYAVKAFDLAAADYLLKPLNFDRLRAAVRRAKARVDARGADRRFAELQSLVASLDQAGPRVPHETTMWVRKPGGLHRLELQTIHYLEADGDYVELHAPDEIHMVRDTISAIEQRLDPARFARCHRSTIVNLERVRSLRRRTGKGLVLTLVTGKELRVGPSYVERITDLMKVRKWR